jgi:hypothetical protein
MYEWLEDLKRIMKIIGAVVGSIIVGIIFFLLSAAVAGFVAGVGNSILKALNETGFTIPSYANYVAPIEGLASSVLLMLRTLFRLPSIIGIIIGIIVVIILIAAAEIMALLKYYGNLGT